MDGPGPLYSGLVSIIGPFIAPAVVAIEQVAPAQENSNAKGEKDYDMLHS